MKKVTASPRLSGVRTYRGLTQALVGVYCECRVGLKVREHSHMLLWLRSPGRGPKPA